MNINLVSLLYISFRLAPFILVSYLCLSSLFSRDFKALIYISGLLIACTITIIMNSHIRDSWKYVGNNHENVPPVCQSLTLTGAAPFSNIPLSQTVFNFTFAYLLFVISKYSTFSSNLPTILIFPCLIIADFIWHLTYQCSTVPALCISILLGGTIGGLWAWMVDSLHVKDIQYFNGITGQSLCSRPSKQKFQCNVISKGATDTKTTNQELIAKIQAEESTISTLLGQIQGFTTQTLLSKQEGFTENKSITIPKSGIYIITADTLEHTDCNAIYTVMIAGTRGSPTPGGGKASDILLFGGSYKSLDDGTSISNGTFSITALDDSYKTIQLFSYEMYPNNSTLLTTKSSVNINTKTGGSTKEFKLPGKGIYYITIDGNQMKDASAIFGFYAIVSDGKDLTHISTLNQLGFKFLSVDGTANGFEASIADRTGYTNYNIYYNQLFDEANAMVLRPTININQNANGSEQTITIPASGTYIITVTNGNTKQTTFDIYSFYITGCLESNHVSLIQEITLSSVTEPKSGYKATGLGNGQFSLVYNLSKDKTTNTFKIYYFKVY
jgi:hypothetical protein